jgi:hypothetical protein
VDDTLDIVVIGATLNEEDREIWIRGGETTSNDAAGRATWQKNDVSFYYRVTEEEGLRVMGIQGYVPPAMMTSTSVRSSGSFL